MTPAERKLAALMLARAADTLSNNGCNDFDLVKDAGLTPAESAEVRARIWSWNGDSEGEVFALEDHMMADWLVARYLADKLEETND